MVEQFNLRGSRSTTESPLTNVTITAPIVEEKEISLNGHVLIREESPGHREVSPPPSDSEWKNSPLYSPGESDEEDEETAEMFKKLSHGGMSLSDTMSSDMIVNSISNGVLIIVSIHTQHTHTQ